MPNFDDVAPRRRRDRRRRRRYDPRKVDPWSFGCVAIELLHGRGWFSDHWLSAYLHFAPHQNAAALPAFSAAMREARGRVTSELALRDVGAPATEMICRALSLDPNARLSVQGLVESEWLAGAVPPEP